MSQGHVTLPLKSIEKRGDYIVFAADRRGSGYDFRAGKYATVSLSPGEGRSSGVAHIFSISSSPANDGELRFATEFNPDSPFKRRLSEMSTGDPVDISPPMGGFFMVSDRARPLVFITSGIGITPVASILKDYAESGSENRVHLAYLNTRGSGELFSGEMEELAEGHSKLSFQRIVDPEFRENLDQGRLLDAIRPKGMESEKSLFYISGKPWFVSWARASLMSSGIAGSSIKMERFSGYS